MVICACLLKTHVCEKNVQTYVVFCSNDIINKYLLTVLVEERLYKLMCMKIIARSP